MNINSLTGQFWKDGYLVLEGFFNTELMDACNRLILDHYGKSPDFFHNQEFLDKAQTEVIPWFPQQEGVSIFDQVENDERLIRLTEAILGTDWYSLYCMTMFSRCGTKGQAWHQDCPPENSGCFNMNRLMYTHDINDETGGRTLVVPGSHKCGELTVGDVNEDFEGQIVLSPDKGTLVLIHGHCWHRVQPVTGSYRVSTNYRSAPKGVPENVTDICVYRNMRYRFETNEIIEDRLTG